MSRSESSELKNRGMVLTQTLEVSGGTIPDGHKVTRCNTEHIACMLWDPLGVWEPTTNQVLRLTSSECGLTVIKSNAIKMRFKFKENDFEQYCVEGATWTYNSVERDDRKTPTQGGYSDKIVVDENYVLRIPENIPMDRAAPLLCAGITLYSPLMHWKAGPGKTASLNKTMSFMIQVDIRVT